MNPMSINFILNTQVNPPPQITPAPTTRTQAGLLTLSVQVMLNQIPVPPPNPPKFTNIYQSPNFIPQSSTAVESNSHPLTHQFINIYHPQNHLTITNEPANLSLVPASLKSPPSDESHQLNPTSQKKIKAPVIIDQTRSTILKTNRLNPSNHSVPRLSKLQTSPTNAQITPIKPVSHEIIDETEFTVAKTKKKAVERKTQERFPIIDETPFTIAKNQIKKRKIEFEDSSTPLKRRKLTAEKTSKEKPEVQPAQQDPS